MSWPAVVAPLFFQAPVPMFRMVTSTPVLPSFRVGRGAGAVVGGPEGGPGRTGADHGGRSGGEGAGLEELAAIHLRTVVVAHVVSQLP